MKPNYESKYEGIKNIWGSNLRVLKAGGWEPYDISIGNGFSNGIYIGGGNIYRDI